MEKNIFISYQKDSIEWVEILVKNLKSLEFEYFFDNHKLIGGKSWIDGLQNGLNSSNIGILVVTPKIFESDWVKKEYEEMLRQKFHIIPIILEKPQENQAFPFLDSIQYIDFRANDRDKYNGSFHKLICAIDNKPTDGKTESYNLTYPTSIKDTKEFYKEFIDEVINEFESNSAILIFSQCKANNHLIIENTKNRVLNHFNSFEVLPLVFPIFDCKTKEFFKFLSKQIGIKARNPNNFSSGLIDKINEKNLFLFISGFESGNDKNRKDLSNILRTLSEQYHNNLKFLIFGGEKLKNLRYGDNILSSLNYAKDFFVPTLKVDYLEVLCDFDELQREEILRVSGGHFELINWLIKEIKSNSIEPKDYEIVLEESQILRQMFRVKLDCIYVRDLKIGSESLLDTNSDLNSLFWKNLIERKFIDGHFKLFWRSEVILRVAKKVFGC